MKEYEDLLLEKEALVEPVTDTKVELARQLFESLESQVMLADRKVQAVFGLNAFLVAALSLQNQQNLAAIMEIGVNLNIGIDLFLKVVFLSCVCIATWSAVRALMPRIKVNHNKTNSGVKLRSLFFFGDIRTQTLNQFSSAFIKLTNEDAVRELLSSSYAISGILNIKYKMLKRSTIFLSMALLIWIFLQVNKFMG